MWEREARADDEVDGLRGEKGLVELGRRVNLRGRNRSEQGKERTQQQQQRQQEQQQQRGRGSGGRRGE